MQARLNKQNKSVFNTDSVPKTPNKFSNFNHQDSVITLNQSTTRVRKQHSEAKPSMNKFIQNIDSNHKRNRNQIVHNFQSRTRRLLGNRVNENKFNDCWTHSQESIKSSILSSRERKFRVLDMKPKLAS